MAGLKIIYDTLKPLYPDLQNQKNGMGLKKWSRTVQAGNLKSVGATKSPEVAKVFAERVRDLIQMSAGPAANEYASLDVVFSMDEETVFTILPVCSFS